MKVSINWAQRYSNVPLVENGIEELVTKIGEQLGAVDEVIDLGKKYQGIIVAKVMSCEKHPAADRLSLCKIDDGGKASNVQRDEHGYVQVVCGAPNVRAGLLVAWLPSGTTVPSSADKEPFVLEAREIRGYVSNGMLASASELAIGDDHSGIVELSEGVPGDDFAELLKLNDYIIDIENKMFTHRPDLFGQLGVAREIAGITGQKFVSPEWYTLTKSSADAESILPLEVRNELPDLVPRFVAVPMSNIEVKPSPLWLQSFLTRVGIRPINNVVDLTNYYMMLTAQPLHAYDYDKVKGNGAVASIVVRYPQDGEKITLLNGKEVVPRKEAIMIADSSRLIGIGGAMGGADTEVDANTKNIIIECATFDMYSIRRTAMEHGLFTDAVTRFNKGQSPLQNDRVVAKIVADIQELAGGKVAGPAIDQSYKTSLPAEVSLSVMFINERLGLSLGAENIKKLLSNVEFSVSVAGEQVGVTPPFWRTDIEIPEDVVEEVGRLYGFDKLPLVLPTRSVAPARRNSALEVNTRIREVLSRAGANEALTYTFVHGNVLEKAGQDKDRAFQLSNALSPDLQYFRMSLTPSLLDKVHPNIKADYIRNEDNEFALFEINKVHGKSELDEDGLPKELGRVSLVFAADDKTAARKYSGAPYYEARKYLTELTRGLGLTGVRFVSLAEADVPDHELLAQMLAPYEPRRSAVVYEKEKLIGVVGEFRSSVRRSFKLPQFTAGFEVFLSSLAKGASSSYALISRFPKTMQDVTFKVPAQVAYQDVFDVIQKTILSVAPEYAMTLGPVDIYQPEADKSRKHITLRIWLAHQDRTIVTEEVNTLLDEVAKSVGSSLGAERI